MAGKPRRLILWLGTGLLAIGLGWALLWSVFATLYVPECPTFSLTSANAHCSTPLLWIYVGYACAALGVAMVLFHAVIGKLRAMSRADVR